MATAILAPLTIPGPTPMTVIGTQGNMFKFFFDQIGYMQDVYNRYGTIAGFVRGGHAHTKLINGYSVFAFGPEYNKQLLSNPNLFYSLEIGRMSPEDSAHRRLWTGLLTMNGAVHRQQRQLMMPAFHKKRVETYRDDMVAIATDVLDTWQPGQRYDISQEMQQLTLRVATKTLFGLDTGREAKSFGALIKRWLELNSTPLVFMFPYDLPGTPYRTLHQLSGQLEADILRFIEQKRASGTDQGDVLSMLLQAHDEDGERMTDTELIGETTILYLAGHETSSNALTWTLFLLSQHPKVLSDLVDELESELHGEAPTVEQLSHLPLLDAVIKESMRLLPPAPVGMRIGIEDFELGKYHMPAGTLVRFSQYITHHMPELYSEPERFLPDRWFCINPSLYEYLPFGGGPRMCIGSTFATMEIKIVLAMLLQRYRLALVPNARIDRKIRITLTTKHGMPMIVNRQDRRFSKNPARGDIHQMVDLR